MCLFFLYPVLGKSHGGAFGDDVYCDVSTRPKPTLLLLKPQFFNTAAEFHVGKPRPTGDGLVMIH